MHGIKVETSIRDEYKQNKPQNTLIHDNLAYKFCAKIYLANQRNDSLIPINNIHGLINFKLDIP